MSGNYSITVRANGTILTASIYNSDHQNHVNNATPQGLGDYSDSVSQMQATSDPGEVGSEDLTGSMAGELERLRFMLAQHSGKTHWYENADRSLSDVLSDTELQNRIDDSEGFSLGDAVGTPDLKWHPMRFVGVMSVSAANASNYIPLVKRDATATGRETIQGRFFLNRQAGAGGNKVSHEIDVTAVQTAVASTSHASLWGRLGQNSSDLGVEFFIITFDWNGDNWIGLELLLTDDNTQSDGYIYFSGLADLRDSTTLQVLEVTDISAIDTYSNESQDTNFFGRDFDVENRIENSNGVALQFSGGDQICFIDDLELERPVGAGAGATMSATWTFPATFVSGSTPTVNSVFAVASAEVTPSRNDITYYGINGAPSSVSDSGVTMAVVAQSNFSEGDTTHFQLMAIGRWFS